MIVLIRRSSTYTLAGENTLSCLLCLLPFLRSVGVFTPDMAFEVICKKQIDKLKEPSLKCVDFVTTELFQVIKKIGEKVSDNLILCGWRHIVCRVASS